MLGRWARPHMEQLAGQLGESVNLAMLDGDQVVYVGQVMASQNSMRMFTEVGRRVLPHSTGVGKAIMATMDPAQVRALLARTGMPSRTEHTITTPDDLLAELERTSAPRVRPRRGRAGDRRALCGRGHPGCTSGVGTVGVRSPAADDRRLHRSRHRAAARCSRSDFVRDEWRFEAEPGLIRRRSRPWAERPPSIG